MIVVFGSINVDLVFRVGSLPQSGETVLSPSHAVHPGGKGANTAVASARAGSETHMVGRIGRDRLADDALRLLHDSGVGTACVAESARPTGLATICVDRNGANAIVVASGANLDATASQVPEALLGADALVALQMEVPAPENWSLARRAKAAGARVMLNLAPVQPVTAQALTDTDILVMNQAEATALADALQLPHDRPADTARSLAGQYGMLCAVTLGHDGAVACDHDAAWRIPALPVKAVDTTGAGDAFCGCLAAALDQRLDIESALRYAAAGAGLACTVEGAQTGMPTREAIRARVNELPALERLA
ncbi:MAG: ribokinase [Rhodospirillales bacterium]|nr:MAG: ribokinase [Rhodospirillales bacterium]